jgi:FAD synthase
MDDIRTYVGTVTDGTGRATRLGFPTLNIPLTDGSISGIYAGTVRVGTESYVAAVYADQRRKVLEAHLIDFPGGAISGAITIQLGQKIRDDKMFDTDEALQLAIADDIEQVKALTTE